MSIFKLIFLCNINRWLLGKNGELRDKNGRSFTYNHSKAHNAAVLAHPFVCYAWQLASSQGHDTIFTITKRQFITQLAWTKAPDGKLKSALRR
ncbi:MAG: hypothetical protein WAS33_07480, partial [Candidatus Promineifilaceae bacterium]